MKKKLTRKTGLKKNIIKKKVFEREIKLCQHLNKEHMGKCGWGRCKQCGVIPLLYKLHKGKLIDKSGDLAEIRTSIFGGP